MRPKEDQSEQPALPIHASVGLGVEHRGLVHQDKHRIAELERENIRLQALVAELLLKNQQLRKPD